MWKSIHISTKSLIIYDQYDFTGGKQDIRVIVVVNEIEYKLGANLLLECILYTCLWAFNDRQRKTDSMISLLDDIWET